MNGPHKNLKVWQDGMAFVTEIYRLTSFFPRTETYSLVDQMRRAALSITSNIAEGYGRSTNKELIHFLYIALGSSNELDSQIEVARNLAYIDNDGYNTLDKANSNINKMLRSLIYKREELEKQPITS